MLDFDSDDIGGMDVDAGDDPEPPPTGRWTATSSYDIYMVDTPKEDNGDKKDTAEDKPPDKNKNDGAGAALSPVTVKIAITARGKTTLRLTPKATIRTQQQSKKSQATPNKRPITATPRAEIIKPPTEGRTVRLTMHSSSRNNV